MVPPYKLNYTTVRQFLQNLAHIYEELFVDPRNDCYSERGATSFMTCTLIFSAVSDIPAAEMVITKLLNFTKNERKLVRI